ncbi:MAG TPA: hypothetical protein PK360_04880, partial [bacterium]|nr:hypothetical protein [bacterium]
FIAQFPLRDREWNPNELCLRNTECSARKRPCGLEMDQSRDRGEERWITRDELPGLTILKSDPRASGDPVFPLKDKNEAPWE